MFNGAKRDISNARLFVLTQHETPIWRNTKFHSVEDQRKKMLSVVALKWKSLNIVQDHLQASAFQK